LNIVITDETEAGDIPIDIYSKLANDRILFIHDDIDDNSTTDLIATLMLKDVEDSEQKISIFINSEGGDLRNIFMLYDTFQILQSPIETICVGHAFNETVLLLAAGTPGMRFATENSLICPSQLLTEGQALFDLADAHNHMGRLRKDNKSFMTELAKCTKKQYKTVMSDFEKKKFFNVKQAIKYGIIDGIIAKNK
jgi:ATP-dependent Clp protease protease subunit